MLRKLSLILALISALALPATDALARGRGGGGGGRGGHGYGGHVGHGVYGGRAVVRRGGYHGGRGYYYGGGYYGGYGGYYGGGCPWVWVPIVAGPRIVKGVGANANLRSATLPDRS